jgi:predicted ATPase
MESFGGLRQVRTRKPGAGTPFRLKVEFRLGEDRSRGIADVHYWFELAQQKDAVKVRQEFLEATVYKRKPGKPSRRGIPLFDYQQTVELRFHREDTRISDWTDTVGTKIQNFDDPQELVLSSYGRLGELRTVTEYISSWRVYNIDATVAKRSTGGSDVELDRYGENIAPYVARLLRDPQMGQRLLAHLQEAVPYIHEIASDRVLTYQTLLFEESDSRATFQLPEMSDGTIRLLGLIAVLQQPVPPAVVVIEEPENALHLYAIQHLLRVARQAAMSTEFATQVFLTSHSPAVVDAVLSPEAMRETSGKTACFVTQRRPNKPSIVAAPESVMGAIADNLGRPSDFQREGSFGDQPAQLGLLGEDGDGQ